MSQVNNKRKTLNIGQSKELEILRKIVEITNSEFDLDLILNETVKIVTDMTKADSVFIYLYDDQRKNLVLMASKVQHKKELGKINIKEGEGITGWVAVKHEIVAIKDNAYKDPRFKSFDILPEDKFEAFLSIPIIHKDKSIGVVNVQHKSPHEYAKNTEKLMALIAKQISGVIVNARLYADMKKKSMQFDGLVKVSNSITSKDYLDEILNLIVVVTAEILNSKICSIMIHDKKENELIIKATQSLSEEYKKKPNIKVENSIIGDVVKTGKPIYVYDVRVEKKYNYCDLAKKEGLTSMLCVPMMIKNNIIGIINTYTKEHHFFSQEEIDTLQMVANQAAVAIENTKLMNEALKAKEALETRKLIERAKGILMRMSNMDEASAYRLIHKKSMDSCKTMKEISESIILMDDIQKGK